MHSGRLSLILFFLILPFAPSNLRAGEDEIGVNEGAVILHEAGALNEALQSLNQNAITGCGDEINHAPQLSPFSDEGFRSLAKDMSCDDLLSRDPPAWIRENKDAGIFKDPTNWQPLCSWTNLKKVNASIHPSTLPPRGLSTSQIGSNLLSAQKLVMRRDLCAQGEKAMRGTRTYTPPSQESMGLKPLSPAAREKWVSSIKNARERVAVACCGKDKVCSDAIEAVEVRFCKHKENPKEADLCTTSGAYYTRTEKKDYWAQVNQALLATNEWDLLTTVKDRFKITPGYIVLSSLGKNDSPANSDSVLLHEFAHACSFIRRDQAINAAWLPAVKEFHARQRRGENCAINENTAKTYTSLFEKLGATDKTIECLLERSAGATERRYVPGKCPGGCPRSHLEEAHAQLLMLKTTNGMIPDVAPKICTVFRDNEHGLTADELRCHILTPAFRKRIEEGLGCRK